MVSREELERQIELEEKKAELDRKKWELVKAKVNHKAGRIEKKIRLHGKLFALKNRKALAIGKVVGKTSKKVGRGLYRAGRLAARTTSNAIDHLDRMEKKQIAIRKQHQRRLNKISKLRKQKKTIKRKPIKRKAIKRRKR